MSRAQRWLKKIKSKDKLGKTLDLNCRFCGMPISQEIYNMDKPWEYECKVCGKQPYTELKDLIDKNQQLNLGNENNEN